MRPLRSLLIGLGKSAVWPAYLGLAAYTARQAPWPRSLAWSTSSVLAALALAAFVIGSSRWIFRPSGWAETVFQIPTDTARQLCRAIYVLATAWLLFILPERLLSLGLVAPGGRPLSAPSVCRFLELAFEVVVLGIAYRLTRSRSAFADWALHVPERFGLWKRHQRIVSWTPPIVIAAIIALDACGYSFSAHRLAMGACQFLLVAALSWAFYRLILRAIDQEAWRWIRIGHHRVEPHGVDASGQPHDLPGRLRRLTAYVVPIVGLLACAWLWDLDLALLRSMGEQVLIPAGATTPALTLGNVTQAILFLLLTAVAWRHLSTCFALVVFPRMTDDPGVRFAVLTLCRYAVLGMGLMAGLSAVHLGPAQIGMVLAALGVGLGFGLQEIVSNFVCGIILLLERPIRVGDMVTVSGMNGTVDRINIRATTITNGDNQSIIVPNRAFITGDLVNWTLRDKVIRASVHVKAAIGSDPDRVTDLLLTIAREDPDVLHNPLPVSFLEDFTDSALAFVLHVHVPDPSLKGRVRHRLMTQIQKRFVEAEIEIPLPAHELLVRGSTDGLRLESRDLVERRRTDPAEPQPPTPHWGTAPAHTVAKVEDCHRGVDE
jgi:potassium efflux system protein